MKNFKKLETVGFIIFVVIFAGAVIYHYTSTKDNEKTKNTGTAEATEIISEETKAIAADSSEDMTETPSDDYFSDSLPDSAYDELAQKSGLSRTALDSQMRELKRQPYYREKAPDWDDSEKPLTDKQLKEIEAEKASIDAEKAAEKAAENSKTTQTDTENNTENNTKEEVKND